MPRTAKSVYIDRDIVAQIEVLAVKEDRTFSAMAEMLLRDGLNSREGFAPYKKTKPATD